MYKYSTVPESRTRTGRNPDFIQWVDTNKGSAEAPRYRSRLVCTKVRHKGVEPIFSETPPLETLRVRLCVACQEDVFRVEDTFLISIADVSPAHFYADAVRDACIRLQDEDPKAKQPGVCGRLRKDNARISECSPTVGRASRSSFGDWKISPMCIFHKDLETYILVHGDDFFIVGRLKGRRHAMSLLRGAYELSKVVTLGPESSQSRTVSFLGRTLTLRR